MAKVIDYQILYSSTPNDIASEVKRLLQYGWQPHGFLVATAGGSFVQAMAKYEVINNGCTDSST